MHPSQTAVFISCNSLIKSPTPTDICQNKSYDNIENKSYDRIDDRPDDDNSNDDNDVDCFPRQDKQPVLQQQDISPTATTATDTSPSLIESPTDKSTDPIDDPSDKVPLRVWNGTQYQFDYNHNHCSICVWDGTTHTNIVYEDDDNDDDANYTYDDYDKCGATPMITPTVTPLI